MELINVLGGSGFVGGRFCELTPNTLVNERHDYHVKSNNILYFISTVDNYNVYTDPFIDIETNLTTLIKTLETIGNRQVGNVTFNFISSWFVYGNVPLPAKETATCDPKGFYSITKRAAEQLLISYCETFGLNYRILRLSNILGPQDKKVSKKKNALQYMINQLKNNEDISLYDGGNTYRDYLYVDDCVDAINLILEKGDLNTIYNVGSGYPTYIGKVIEYAKEQLNSTSNIGNIPPAEFHNIVQTKNMVLDTTKLQLLGFKPKYSSYDIVNTLIK
jgi:nucleoside-diphosphate-sugar epimerase